MADQWFQSRLLKQVNDDPELELECKFIGELQSFVTDCKVGISAQRANECKERFEQAVEKGVLQERFENSRVYFLSADLGSQRAYLETLDVFQKYGTSLRVIQIDGEEPQVVVKKRLPIPEVDQTKMEGFFLSLSREHVLDENIVEEERHIRTVLHLFRNLPPFAVCCRRKERQSFIQSIQDGQHNSIPVISYDLTKTLTTYENLSGQVATDSGDDSTLRFEVEMEYIGNKHPKGGTECIRQDEKLGALVTKLFFRGATKLICLIQNCPRPLNVMQHNAVVRNYMEMVGIVSSVDPYRSYKNYRKNLFVGTQPVSLHRVDDLHRLVDESCFVMDKTDGERALLFALPTSQAEDDRPTELKYYLIDRWIHVKPTPLVSRLPGELDEKMMPAKFGFLIDGEVIADPEGPKGHRIFLAFDLIRIGSNDMRPRPTFRRLETLAALTDLIGKYSRNTGGKLPPLNVRMKEYVHWPRGVAKAGDLIVQMQHRPYGTDGLVFTFDMPYPMNGGRSAKAVVMKWKGEASTVDLLTKKRPSGYGWDAFCAGSFATIRSTQERCLIFRKIQDNTTLVGRSTRYWVVMESGLIVVQPANELVWSEKRSLIPFPFVPRLPEKNLGVPLEDGMVFEFSYVREHNQLKALCKRVDKSVLGKDGTNDLRVAVDVWESMKYPITQSQLMALPKIVDRTPKNQIGSYPFAGDIDGSLDWHSIFNGGRSGSMDPPSIMKRLRRVHNSIKSNLIKRVALHHQSNTTVPEMLQEVGALRVQSRDVKSNEQFWSLPNTKASRQLLRGLVGAQVEKFLTVDEQSNRLLIAHGVFANIARSNSVAEDLIVLDLACGKGGDLWKWSKTQAVSLWIGVDNVDGLLWKSNDAALKRLQEIRASNPSMRGVLFHADGRQPLYPLLKERLGDTDFEVDVVSCMFAMHYFWTSENSARSFLQNVKDMLKPDGSFIGTIVDGRRLFQKLQDNNGELEILWNLRPEFPTEDTPSYAPTLLSVGCRGFDPEVETYEELSPYGNEVTVKIMGSIIDEYIDKEEKNGDKKQENLVKFEQFRELAAEFDLVLVESQTFDQFPQKFNQLDEPFRHYSGCHRTFWFRKISRGSGSAQMDMYAVIDEASKLQHQQSATMTLPDDRRSDINAYDAAYPSDQVVSNLVDTAPEIDPMSISVSESSSEEEAEEEPTVHCSRRCSKGVCRRCICVRSKHYCNTNCGCGGNCSNRRPSEQAIKK